MLNLTFFPDSGSTLASVLDISDIKRTEGALREAVASQNAIFAAVPDLMFEMDDDGRYLNIWASNPDELAASKERLLGRTVSEMLPADAAEQAMTALKEAGEKGQSFGRQIQLDTPDGMLWFELSVSLKERDTPPHHFIVLSRNITDRKQLEAELVYRSNHDPLTGLYNRRMLEKQLAKDIQRAARYKRPLSLFMVDIDHFKSINDTHGHRTGDFILTNIAKVLEEVIRETDYSSRYGGEEFVIVLPETPLTDAKELAERLRTMIAGRLFKIADGNKLSITISIGVSVFTGENKSLDALLNSADSAMYFAKESGRNCVRVAENTV
ncbi:MAG: GGDEF domain-containing protein [gamma proteobacterium endosymbiont of Lamellibrachia anaximandri]|nr:GGDEF domain-containing protein [gamma proteobacterium endosymbiont of Lamellibrachia anaximandri]